MHTNKSKIYYAVQLNSNRLGEFEFLTHCQEHMSTDLEKTKEEIEDIIYEERHNYVPPLSRKKAIEEMGGKPQLLKIEITLVSAVR